MPFVFLLLTFLLRAVSAHAAETPIPPAPTRWVTDTEDFLSPEAVRTLDARLEAYGRATGRQLIVYIGRTTGDAPIDDWAVRAFEAWKVGRQGMDDGLALFIMSEDRRLRIEVGYGLEGQVPDATAFRIINEVIVPRIRAGDRDDAVLIGMDAVVRVISGQGLSDLPDAPSPASDSGGKLLTTGQLVVLGIVGILFLILLVTHPSLALYLLASILSSSGRRGGGFGGGGRSGGFGGGFSGGGGRSGGGGASGSW